MREARIYLTDKKVIITDERNIIFENENMNGEYRLSKGNPPGRICEISYSEMAYEPGNGVVRMPTPESELSLHDLSDKDFYVIKKVKTVPEELFREAHAEFYDEQRRVGSEMNKINKKYSAAARELENRRVAEIESVREAGNIEDILLRLIVEIGE